MFATSTDAEGQMVLAQTPVSSLHAGCAAWGMACLEQQHMPELLRPPTHTHEIT